VLAVFTIIFSLGDPAFGTSRNPRYSQDQGKEVQYWNDLHRREYYRRLNEKIRFQEQRADIRITASNLVQVGESLAPAIMGDQTSSPLSVRKPSIFDGKEKYILLGLTFILFAILTTITLIRHRREAEIRVLSGKYLADGREAAHFHMPALFEAPLAPSRTGDADYARKEELPETEDDEGAPKPDPLAKFFADVPDQLANIRKALPKLRRALDETDRRRATLELHELISILKEQADCWDLRPVWQLTSALELLLKRLAEKPKDATPSTVRTVASALDLLAKLCVPGVRPDLIINPPIEVLAVDDDPLCLRAVVFALQKAEMKPDVAQNGEGAIILATEKSYDVIFMDIQMPRINGLVACEEIHALKKNNNTPVVFVTVQSDFRTRTESSLVGGADIMAKPFLMFEITVKALMLAMRKRLNLAASCEREVAVKLALASNDKPAEAPTLAEYAA
jgi:CheY-like chemotaxis protein